MSRTGAVVCTVLICLNTLSAQKCNSTFESIAANDPNLGLLSTAITTLTPAGQSSLISSDNTSITVFAPTDTAFISLLSEQKLALGDLTKISDKLLALLLQSILLESYSAEELASLKTAPSALGELLKEDYPLSFESKNGKTTVSAKGNKAAATITKSIVVCDSWLHIVDLFLLPASSLSKAPSITPAQIAGVIQNKTSNSTEPGTEPVIPDSKAASGDRSEAANTSSTSGVHPASNVEATFIIAAAMIVTLVHVFA